MVAATTSGSCTPATSSARRIVGPERLQVRPRRDLGHHAAEPGVLVDAGGHLVGQQRHRAVGVEPRDADSGFVAGAFDGQDESSIGLPPPPAASCRRRRR